jgi:hypothetical protein
LPPRRGRIDRWAGLGAVIVDDALCSKEALINVAVRP